MENNRIGLQMIFLSKRKNNYSFFILLCILLNFLPSCTRPVIKSEKIEIPEEKPVINKAQKKENKKIFIEKYKKLLKEIQHNKSVKDEIIRLINIDIARRGRDYDWSTVNRVKDKIGRAHV